MQIFYEAWRIVQAFIAADAKVPAEVALPRPVDREVARILAERREFPVLDVIEAIKPFGQPELLHTDARDVETQNISGEVATERFLAPLSKEPNLLEI